MAHLASIWRHPVKSLQGNQLDAGVVEADGLHGDRGWGIRDESTGRILTGRREPRLLGAAGALTEDGQPEITLPDGSVLRGPGAATDAALSDWLGHAVALVAAGRRARRTSRVLRRRHRRHEPGDRVDDAGWAVRRRAAAAPAHDRQPARRRQAPPGRSLGRAAVPAEPADRRRRRRLDRGRVVRPHRARRRGRARPPGSVQPLHDGHPLAARASTETSTSTRPSPATTTATSACGRR